MWNTLVIIYNKYCEFLAFEIPTDKKTTNIMKPIISDNHPNVNFHTGAISRIVSDGIAALKVSSINWLISSHTFLDFNDSSLVCWNADIYPVDAYVIICM